MTTWEEALEAYKQDIRDINNLKDKRHAIKQTALVLASSGKDYVSKLKRTADNKKKGAGR
jgi:hypothetical protein